MMRGLWRVGGADYDTASPDGFHLRKEALTDVSTHTDFSIALACNRRSHLCDWETI